MKEQISMTGMVLAVSPIGEYDKRVVILTRERGKIHAFARGARRPNGALLAAANPFCFGTFYFYEGRDAYTLVKAEVQNYFRELSQDFEGACYGFYFLEFADYYARENNDESELLKLLYVTMRALLKPQLDRRLVRVVYELKAMVLNGEYPQVFECVECGRSEALTAYIPKRDGLVCSGCAPAYRGGIPLSGSTVYALQYVVSTPLQKLYTFTVSEEVLGELREVMRRFVKKYIDRTFKSLEILEADL